MLIKSMNLFLEIGMLNTNCTVHTNRNGMESNANQLEFEILGRTTTEY